MDGGANLAAEAVPEDWCLTSESWSFHRQFYERIGRPRGWCCGSARSWLRRRIVYRCRGEAMTWQRKYIAMSVATFPINQ